MESMWIKTLEFFIPGLPQPGGSKRGFFIPSLKRVVISDANKKVKGWKDTVAAFASDFYKGELMDGAVKVDATFIMPRIKGHFGTGKKLGQLKDTAPHFHTVKPDALKLMRSTEDALTGILWRDDSANVFGRIEKIYGDRTGARITISVLAAANAVDAPEKLFEVTA